ncbi:MAG: hypothetical protein JRJ12_01910 [Deltaproteobacteria bacterium]|nr:hypothetical protein [Deltaproteobacteria bacterium]MBW2069877.1 hypothetical protein [Deltaproteobacteria bacterium]
MKADIPFEFYIRRDNGLHLLKIDTETLPLPRGPDSAAKGEPLSYGIFLKSIARVLCGNSGQGLQTVLRKRLGYPVQIREIQQVRLISEKHGACYHVARLDIRAGGETISYAVNVAATPEARKGLQREVELLQELAGQYDQPFLPRLFFNETEHLAGDGEGMPAISLFITEWLTGFHEFHLHQSRGSQEYRLLLWDTDRGFHYLSSAQEREVYRQAARILTLYYDWNHFKQIYPWHLAAGDFVLKKKGNRIDLRLVTVRDYTPVVSFRTKERGGKLLALILFFLHLTIQLRLDRLDGVGEVACANGAMLAPVVQGFLEGLATENSKRGPDIPSRKEMSELLRSFSQNEWHGLMTEFFDTYGLSAEEFSVFAEEKDSHLNMLRDVLANLL